MDEFIEAGDYMVDVLNALREAYARASAIPEDVVAKRAINKAMALVGQAQDIIGDEVVRLSLERGE